MIIKINNQSKNFYSHLGKIFGSREVERITHDRMYDDDNKEWYVYYHQGNPSAFVSVANNKVKNVYSDNKKYLVAVLQEVNKKENIITSIVTKAYVDQYKEAGFIVEKHSVNFVEIRGVKNGEED